MTRFLLHYVIPLLLPFAVYFGIVALTRGRHPGWLDNTPWFSLSACGLGLVAVGLVAWGLLSGSAPGERYLPPRFEDGRIVPGRTVEIE